MISDINGDFHSPIGAWNLPSLQALRCFEAAAREESFRRAADVLHLTHGAVSRAVRLIEEDLGVALFERRNRRVYLTREGRKLADALTQGFQTIGTAYQELRERSRTAPVILACEPTLMMRWLIPRLPSFQITNPQIDLHLVAASGPALGHGVDMSIRRNDVPWPDEVEAIQLFEERVGPVCRYDLRERFFSFDGDSAQLKASALLLHTATRADAWKIWAKLSGQSLRSHLSRNFEHFYYSLQAAVAGVGVAIGPWELVKDDIESGLLSAPLGFIPDGSAYYLLTARRAMDTEAHTLVSSWLLGIAQEKSETPARTSKRRRSSPPKMG